METPLTAGYKLHSGSPLDRALLLKFMQRTYQELFPGQSFAHLAITVDQYLSKQTPLWWVTQQALTEPNPTEPNPTGFSQTSPIACLWLGNAIDQVQGDRQAHIFLLYVQPQHRRRGIATALLRHAEAWAKARGDRQINLQVFQHNQPALRLYEKLGYGVQSFWMGKLLE